MQFVRVLQRHIPDTNALLLFIGCDISVVILTLNLGDRVLGLHS